MVSLTAGVLRALSSRARPDGGFTFKIATAAVTDNQSERPPVQAKQQGLVGQRASGVEVAVFHPNDQHAVLQGFLEGFRDSVWQFAVQLVKSHRVAAAFAAAWAAWAVLPWLLLGWPLPHACTAAISLLVVAALWAAALPVLYHLGCLCVTCAARHDASLSDMQDVQRSWLETPGRCFWVARLQGAVVGGVALAIGPSALPGGPSAGPHLLLGALSRTDAVVFRMFTAQTVRRRGVGSQLLSHAEAHARLSGCARLLLTTGSVAARAFYRHNGFAVVHVKSHSVMGAPPVNIFVMEKHLPLTVKRQQSVSERVDGHALWRAASAPRNSSVFFSKGDATEGAGKGCVIC